MNNAPISRRKILTAVAAFLLLVLLFSTAMFLINLWENKNNEFDSERHNKLEESLEFNGKKYVLNKDLETILFIGRDKSENINDETAYNNDQQADFLMLLVIDNENSSYVGIQINRDTMADVSILGVAGDEIGTVKQQIALAHTYGNGRHVSCINTADAVSSLLNNVKIDHFVSLTMEAVPIVNDAVGGVSVTVLDDFSGIDDTLIKDSEITLMGDQALTYVRSRYGMDDSTNQNRMVRQRQYLNALYDKCVDKAKDDESFIVDLSAELSDHMISDYSVNLLQKLFTKITNYELEGIITLEGEIAKGTEYIEFYPDAEALKKLVVDVFYKPEE